MHMKYSASLLPGNLSVAREAEGKGSLTYAIIHKSSVALSHVANGACRQVLVDREQREGSPRCPLLQVEKRDVTIEAGSYSVTDSLFLIPHSISQARWCCLQSKTLLLVLTSYKTFEVAFEHPHSLNSGRLCHQWHALSPARCLSAMALV